MDKITTDFLNEHCFNLVQGKITLEIGCFSGIHTQEIIKHDPKTLIVLEAAEIPLKHLKQTIPQCRAIHGDMHLDLKQVGKVDVAFLLGVIYHSHAPLHVFEELVYHCSPDTIILDNPGQGRGITEETPNMPGMRYTTDGRKTCKLISHIEIKHMIQAFVNLGYQLENQWTYPDGAVNKASSPILQLVKV
jgi:hypothetical protein